MGLNDLQRKFMIQMGLSERQMNTQIAVTFFHILWNILFVTYLELGIVGTGISSLLTNILGFFINCYLTSKSEEIEEANSVSIFDKRVIENMGIYLKIGLPNVAILMLDWTCFEVSSLMAG